MDETIREFTLQLSFFDNLSGEHLHDLEGTRLVDVDLSTEEDYGDISPFMDSTTGEWHPFGFGNDFDGYWKIEKIFEPVRREESLTNGTNVRAEISFARFDDILRFWTDYWSS